ncbi:MULTISPECIES: hypothetical protein [Jeotgalibacillus]|uniref:hypothetical protein n=1 Tax=Jeotgalibacillus TaxID=157226 RepID=UPI00106BE3B2|nr:MULTISPECIES: hypothetical protein [Jeotgalibacillus]TFD98400.1 hypothetical protein E2491_08160 [Jeotgalibacillus sp. R-1-5s-1]
MRITIDLEVIHVKPRAKSHLSNVIHFTDAAGNRFIWTTAVDKGLVKGEKVEAQISVNEELYDEEGKYVRISHVAILKKIEQLKETTYTRKPFSIMDRPGKKEEKKKTEDHELLNDIEKTLALLRKK